MTLAVNGGGLLSALMFLATTIIVFPLSRLSPAPPLVIDGDEVNVTGWSEMRDVVLTIIVEYGRPLLLLLLWACLEGAGVTPRLPLLSFSHITTPNPATFNGKRMMIIAREEKNGGF